MAKHQRICLIPHSSKSAAPGGRAKTGAPLKFIREVALPYQGDDCLLWPFAKSGRGYGALWIDGKQVRAHRHVCLAVHGDAPSDKHEAAHSCGNLGCVNPRHLSWKTASGNQMDRVDHDTHIRGERNHFVKLTESQVSEIIRIRGTKSQREIAADFGVSQSAVAMIHSGKTWKWLIDRTSD
ncbi:hypothetical protein GOB48_22105 [Sinorhizobium meliloti]|nr:hypothetical protein [Sinorhizobium meliloti]